MIYDNSAVVQQLLLLLFSISNLRYFFHDDYGVDVKVTEVADATTGKSA
jgi:hypothetical protein